MNNYSDSRLTAEFAQSDRIMTPEEFTQIVEAILQGKYSWACVLILRSAGYNPLHYIPYRTYKRIIKENRQDPQQPLGKIAINSDSDCKRDLIERHFREIASPR